MSEGASISQQIWDMKYRLKDSSGVPVESSILDSWRRVARSLAGVEENKGFWEAEFYKVLEDFYFLPAGRILAGIGTNRKVTLFNCFVMGDVPDDMGGIFDSLKEAALTMQQGGGIGYDFSTIRPKGSLVKGVGADASGPISFMDVWDSMCGTIMSAGTRRGAMMAVLRCDHPDILDFIDVKKTPSRLRMFNLSVLVTDDFMEAVKKNLQWELRFNNIVFNTLPAREIWEKIMKATYAYAEPGVIFIDRINKQNNLYYCETIHATNPCGEQPLPPYGACLLGSINLAKFINKPFESDATFDFSKLESVVKTAIRMLDNVIDISKFPLTKQRDEAFSKRRVGLGITGLANALIMCGFRYGSDKAVSVTENWLKVFQNAAYTASIDLAVEKGPFPLFEKKQFLKGSNIRGMNKKIREGIAKHGIRNSLLTSVAPTGTISLLADNVSSGLEPVFSFQYIRKVLMPDGSHKEEDVTDYAFKLYRELKGKNTPLTDTFVNAQKLKPKDHLIMQAAVQKYIDSSISKTINVPESIPFEVFKDIYVQAFDLGCKGCTTYRPNQVTGAVLREKCDKQIKEQKLITTDAEGERKLGMEDGVGAVVQIFKPLDRPQDLKGKTYKIRWPESDHAIYITLNDIIDESGRVRPFEIFINSKNMEYFSWAVALTRMISAVFRRGGDISFVVEELKAVFDPRGGQWMQGRYIPSLLAAIGEVVEKHLIEIDFLPSETVTKLDGSNLVKSAVSKNAVQENKIGNFTGAHMQQCPKCGQASIIKQEGCDNCITCGYSKCG